jgi:hypothetical protein
MIKIYFFFFFSVQKIENNIILEKIIKEFINKEEFHFTYELLDNENILIIKEYENHLEGNFHMKNNNLVKGYYIFFFLTLFNKKIN